jgi:2-dehydropantoate 2-reductase
MKVAVYGAGALGGVYGVRLAVRGHVDVTFVVRPARVSSTEPIVIEKVRGDERETLVSPRRVAIVPEDSDVILLAVGTEELDSVKDALSSSDAPVVILTPMFPEDWARVRRALGERALSAMPNVVAYTRRDGVIRYWLPPVAMKIDEPRRDSPSADAVRELTEALCRAGLRARLELGVHEKNPATTVCFIAFAAALSVAGSVEALVADDALLSLAARACREGVSLSHRIGEPEPWARLSPLVSAPWAARAWLGMLGRVSPEGLFYAEEHFGRKLRAQHRVMIAEMIELARERRLPHGALDELAVRLERTPS